MRRRIVIALNVAGWVSLAVTASAQTPRVGSVLNCSTGTISGSYGYVITGSIASVPAADYGQFVADGNGSFSGSSTVSAGGVLAARTLSGSYTVTAACTGVSIFKDSLGNVAHFAFTVDRDGGAIEFVQTDSGTVISGQAEHLASGCDASAFSGPYTYALSGWFAAFGTYVPNADAGRFLADGKGNFTGKSTYSEGGIVGRRTFSGTYTIKSGCSGTVAMTDSLGNAVTLAASVVNNGQEILFIQTDAGTVAAGRARRGQFSCSAASVSGPYRYSIGGYGVLPGVLVPVAYSGLLTADGNGSMHGSDAISQGGVVNSRSISATYTVNSDCSGSAVVTDTLGEKVGVDFYVTDQGGQVEFIQTDNGLAISGESQQQASGSCSNATVSGAYGYALEGWLPGLEPVADAGQFTSDGAGHFAGATTTSYGGSIVPRSISGTYQTNADCSGTSTFRDTQGNTANFRFTVSQDGRQIAFVETDAGTIISGSAEYQVGQPSAAIVNSASFAAAVAPGSLISIFGSGLGSGTSIAQNVPWPTLLGNTSVLVNGKAIPSYYVSPGQINAQLPVDLAPGTAQLTVSVGGASSAPVNFQVSVAAPGIFTYGLLRAAADNPDGSLNGPSAPAHAADEMVVYLTGAGPVQPTGGTLVTGALPPPGIAPVTKPYAVTVGGIPVTVDYLGLSGYIGLYQLNLRVPALPTGDHTLVVTVNGTASSSAVISISQ